MALSGLIFLGVMIVLQIIGQGGGLAAQQTREPAIIIIFTALNTVFGMVVQLWVTIGFAIFMLKAARNEQPSLNDFGAAGPYFLRGILMQLIIVLVSASVLAVCLAPAGVLYLVTGEQDVAVIAAVIGALVAAPLLIYFMYRWFLALFFIVDCNLSPTESLAQSAKFMVGNKLVAFLVILVVSIAGGLFSLVTCCFGYLLFIPYMHLTMAAVYLSATGQPWGQTLGVQKSAPMK